MLCNAPLSTSLVAHAERTGGRGGKEHAPADEAAGGALLWGGKPRRQHTPKSSKKELTDGDDLMDENHHHVSGPTQVSSSASPAQRLPYSLHLVLQASRVASPAQPHATACACPPSFSNLWMTPARRRQRNMTQTTGKSSKMTTLTTTP